jgi:hypothetical protein
VKATYKVRRSLSLRCFRLLRERYALEELSRLKKIFATLPTYRQVQVMSKHKDPKTVMRYDHGRENLDQNAVNFLAYDEE